MNRKVLCVDDDPRVLRAYQRNLAEQFQMDTATSGAEALKVLSEDGPYAVVVADMRMPEMDGIELLRRVQETAPDTVRIMLTGNADQQTAVDAVNQGQVYRFLNKPCPPEILALALSAGLSQYHSVVAERELLEQTLNGSVQMLTDVLSMSDPQAFALGQKFREQTRAIARVLQAEHPWELELAAMLSPIGYVTIPPTVLQKRREGFGLTGPEKDMLQRVPEAASQLIGNIPRLETVAKIVRYQEKHFDGSGFPLDDLAGEAIPLGSRILKVLSDLAHLEAKGVPRFKALQQMRTQAGCYDPKVLAAAFESFEIHQSDAQPAVRRTRPVTLRELRIGNVLAEKIESNEGMIIAGAGLEVTQMVLDKLHNFAQVSGIKEPVLVLD